MRQVKRAVVASVDAGRPVLMDEEETGLVVGYFDGGEELLVREPYSIMGDEPTALSQWPWNFGVLVRLPVTPSLKSVAKSLAVAVELSRAEAPIGNDYACGRVAYQRWISTLLGQPVASAPPIDGAAVVLGNAHIYYCLVDARHCACQYLRHVEGQFDDAVRPSLLKAAALYEETAETLDSGRANVPWPQQLKLYSDWTLDQRSRQAGLLRQASSLEQEAITNLEVVLAHAA
jgi:hypothetical protein